jgi:hypothetical protein
MCGGGEGSSLTTSKEIDCITCENVEGQCPPYGLVRVQCKVHNGVGVL